MKKECWALMNKQGKFHRDMDFDIGEAIMPKVFRTRKDAEREKARNPYFKIYEPTKVTVCVKQYHH